MGTSNRMAIALFILLGTLLAGPSSWAADVGILVDISGSLRTLPVSEGRALLAELLIKGQTPSSWEVISVNEDSEAGKLLKGKQPLLQENNRLLLMTFGSRKGIDFPYFNPPRISQINPLEDARQKLLDFYPRNPEDHKDHYTYLDLALAVASESFHRAGSDHFLLIVLSDFQESKVLTRGLTREQEKMETDFRTQKELEHKQSVNIRHATKELLQARVYEVRYGKGQETPPVKPPVQEPRGETPKEIKLLAPKGEIDGKNVTFKWTPVEGATKYRLECKLGNETKIKYGPPEAKYEYSKELPPGEYTWEVGAIMPNDQKVTPGKGKFKVTGGGGGLVLIPLLGVPAALALYYYRKPLLALLGFPRKGTGIT